MTRPVLLIAAAVLVAAMSPLSTFAADPVPTSEAARHVGKTVTLCGPVAGAAHFDRLKGEPTFLNFDRAYPEQTFTVVIWGADAVKFERPPHRMFARQDLCVTGLVETYRGKPQIVVRDPKQITVAVPRFEEDRFAREERVMLKALLAELGYAADMGDDAWDEGAESALRAFQDASGIEPGEARSARTLRALAEAVDRLDAEARGRVLKLLLLNLAQREESPSR